MRPATEGPAETFAERKKPAIAAPGETVEVTVRAIQAIWNPRPSDFRMGIGLQLNDLSWRKPDQPTVTVFESQPSVTDFANKKIAAKGFSFEVPDVDRGRYLLIIYDGSEAGNHFTWDFVRVPSSSAGSNSATPADGVASNEDDDFLLIVLLLTAAGGALAVAVFWRVRRN